MGVVPAARVCPRQGGDRGHHDKHLMRVLFVKCPDCLWYKRGRWGWGPPQAAVVPKGKTSSVRLAPGSHQNSRASRA